MMQIGVRRLSSLASITSRPWQQLSLQHPKPLSQESDSGVSLQLAQVSQVLGVSVGQRLGLTTPV